MLYSHGLCSCLPGLTCCFRGGGGGGGGEGLSSTVASSMFGDP